MTPTEAADAELLPCPFCGAKAELDECHGYHNAKGELRRQVAIFCTGCSANMCWPRDDFKGEDKENLIHGVVGEWNARSSTPAEKEAGEISDAQIKGMVDRFLGWRLPKPWSPDNGISYQRPNYAHAPADHDWPTGTNLFSAEQATAMVRHMIEGSRARPALVTSRLDKALANFLAVERAEDESFWPLYREVRDAYDEMKRDGFASVTDALSIRPGPQTIRPAAPHAAQAAQRASDENVAGEE